MTRNSIRTIVFLMAVAISGTVLTAQTTVDTRQLFVPINPSKNAVNAQLNGFQRPMMLQHSVAQSAFEQQGKNLTLSNFPLPGNESSSLVLERTRAVVDANTEFYTHTKDGKVKFKVRPVVSYRGTVNGDPGTMVTLHYSQGNVTGFVQMSNGQRTVIGRDFSIQRAAEATPHLIADEATMFNADPLSRFICGNEELPVDEEVAARKMTIPGKAKGAEMGQADYLREFKMAMVLREDIDSVMKRRGESDEEIAQYFVKLASAMAQVYEQELDAYLYISYFEKFTNDEPSGYYYDGREPGELLNEFSLDWSSRMSSVDRTVAHLYALIRPVGGSFVGGIAFLDQLCNKKHRGGYGVSTVYLNASEVPGDPNRSNAFVWDVFVAAHEMGHNIGAYHTHNCYWSPPVDTCQLKQDNTDACYSDPALRRVVDGTIMSYCHLVNGSRTPLTFGTRVAERMRGWVATSTCTPAVTKPMVQITEPRGSDAYNLGEKMTIRWASARVSNVNISWGNSPAGPWTTVASNIDAADRQYLWTIPAIPVPEFWVRVSDASNEAVNDTSLASYRVTIPVVIDAPKGGERFGQGSAFTVRWTKAAGVGNVKLEFSADGSTYEVLGASLTGSSFNWTVPTILTESARMRVSAVSSPGSTSTSGAFAIGVRRFALEIPGEGTFLCKNQPNQYRWSADFIPTIRIQYSTDAGGSWRTATQQSTIETSQWQIFSRNVNMNNVPKGTPLKLRVIDAVTEEVLDTRENLVMDSCDAPVSVSETSEDVPFSITSISPNPATSVVRLSIGSTDARQCSIVLISGDGREIVLNSEVSLVPGSSSVELPLGNVASGSYRIAVRNGNMQVVAPLMIVR
ncbi:MAG: hypothetical protein IPH85_01760 [Ignavibacteria bacterium]|nr:hypothetical protein [Ignavibacteria bacterium]MBK7184646.1 hypothetical protein [Ignavibacteria bacterium]MBL0321145.1 hypothetical protein [Ignavibacteria bacterium]